MQEEKNLYWNIFEEREVEVAIWESYDGWIAEDIKSSDIIATAPSRRELGFILVKKGYGFMDALV